MEVADVPDKSGRAKTGCATAGRSNSSIAIRIQVGWRWPTFPTRRDALNQARYNPTHSILARDHLHAQFGRRAIASTFRTPLPFDMGGTASTHGHYTIRRKVYNTTSPSSASVHSCVRITSYSSSNSRFASKQLTSTGAGPAGGSPAPHAGERWQRPILPRGRATTTPNAGFSVGLFRVLKGRKKIVSRIFQTLSLTYSRILVHPWFARLPYLISLLGIPFRTRTLSADNAGNTHSPGAQLACPIGFAGPRDP